MSISLNNPKIIRAWCLYDWSNSVYQLTITSTIFPVYYNSVTRSLDRGDIVSFFGFELPNTVLYSYSLSFSFLLIACFSPLLSGIADYSGQKKAFMKFFTVLGAASCSALFFFTGSNVEFGIICSILASVGYSGSLVFYNSYLPEIATPDRYDQISARGFSLGYLGSVLLLIFNLIMIEMPEIFGLNEDSMAARISFLTVGIWWIGFSQITFNYLPGNIYHRKPGSQIIKRGYQEILQVFKTIKRLRNMSLFLLSFFFYSAGLMTVMYLAATFGDKELKLASHKLIFTILIIQLVGIAGSYFFAFLSKMKGNRFSLLVMVWIWILICFYAFYFETEYQFYGLAIMVGLVMGGIQSLSRATYSKLIPGEAKDHASYFSFYDVTEKIAIVGGTLSFGLIEHVTGSMRNSTLVLALYFAIGLVFLYLLRIPGLKNSRH